MSFAGSSGGRSPLASGQLGLLALALALAVTALGRPMLPLSSDVFRHLIVFDITQSMNVGDAVPSDDGPTTRLEHAKAAVLEATAALPCGSEVGLALFTGHRAFLVLAPVEVCENYADISNVVDAVDWRMAWAARSEIAKGVHSGLTIAEALGPTTSLVFVTDGHEAPPLHAELRPRFTGDPGSVRGLLAGVGGSVPLAIPKLDPQGRNLGHWEADEVIQGDELSLGRPTGVPETYAGDETGDVEARIASGTEHLSMLRESYLRSLANELRLHYRRVGDTGDLKQALQHPDLANDTEVSRDLRPLLAGMAALFLAGSYLLPGRWRNGRPAGTSRPERGGPVPAGEPDRA